MRLKLFILTFTLIGLATQIHAVQIRVYAAISLTSALDSIAKQYEKKYPKNNVILVYGASSTLAKQIEAGAKADLFFSADQSWMDYLVNKQIIAQSQPILQNELVVISPKNVSIPFTASPDFKFAQSFKGKLCTGQTESVPLGKYAKQSLISLKWFDHLNGRIVGTEHARAAITFVERGECDVGIVYKTDALVSQKIKILGVLPASTHKKIVYPIALTESDQPQFEAKRFYDFVINSPQAKATFENYGFKTIR